MSSNGETIKILRSGNSGSTPSLTAGEIAVNMPDKKLFIGTENGTNIVFRDESYVSSGVAGVSSIVVGNNSLTGGVRFSTDDFSISGGTVGITGTIARLNKQQVFSSLQTFASGLSATTLTADAIRTNGTLSIKADTVNIGSNSELYPTITIAPLADFVSISRPTTFASTLFGTTGNFSKGVFAPNVLNGLAIGASSFTAGTVSITSGSNVTITTNNNLITISSSGGVVGATGDTVVQGTGISVSRTNNEVSVGLADGYQITGDTIIAGSNISISRLGSTNSVTINSNEGLASYTLTGVASFDPSFFGIGTSGHLVLTGAYQVTGNTVVTNANSGIAVETLNNRKTLTNIGVTGIALAGTAITLTGGVSLTGSGNVSIIRSGNTLTISSSGGGGATGDTILPDGGNVGATNGAIWVSTVSGNTKRVTARLTSSVIVSNNGIPLGMPGAGTSLSTYGEEWDHGKTGVGYFNDAQFIVNPTYGLVSLRNPFFTFAPDSGLTTITGPSGEDLTTFDIDSLSEMTVGTVEPTDYVLVYDASLTSGNKTKKIPVSKLILDTDTLFETVNPDQLVKTKSASAISYEIVTAPVTAESQSLLKSGDAYTYITQNTVKSLNGQTGDVAVVGSLNGCTGTITITGTANRVVVSNSCPTITIGLPDNVSIPYLSGTGATFTQTVTATRFIGIVSGGDF